MTESTTPAPEPGIRRLATLRTKYPDDTPAQLATRLNAAFTRDFTLVGATSAGAAQFTPNAVGTLIRNPKIALATQAASHLGSTGQKIADINRGATHSVAVANHVSSARLIKTYVHAMALLHGRQVSNAEDAADQLLGYGVNDLLAALDAASQPAPTNKTGAVNILGAVGVFAARNPQAFLLIKAGEQLAKTGSAVLTNTKARQDFARKLIEQVQTKLGEAPAGFPAELTSVLSSVDPTDHTETEPAPTPDEVAPSPTHEPQDVTPSPAPEPDEVRASTAAELDEANGATARGARFAARAFVKARNRLKNQG